jgi:integrative and conjugative element protein (TIGR02256 family)
VPAVAPPELFVDADVLRHLYRLPPTRDEVGGWLLGYWDSKRTSVIVTHATPPGPRGAPSGVEISAAGHATRFEEAWQQSAGHITFLGDWHTHPGGVPIPSDTDRVALKQLAENTDFQTPTPLIAIASVPRWRWARSPRHVAFFLRAVDGGVLHLDAMVFEELPIEARGIPDWWR